MKRNSFHFLLTASLLLLDLGGLALAFELAYRTRFFWPFILGLFPATKGIPDIALYHQALAALLPVCLLVFFYSGFYQEALLGAYDEFVRVLRAVLVCSLLAMAMTFAYRGAEYSRLTIALWSFYSLIFLYGLREIYKSLFRGLFYRISGPRRTLVIGKGKAAEAIQEVSQRQPYVQTLFLELPPSKDGLSAYIDDRRITDVVLLQSSVTGHAILEVAQVCEAMSIPCQVVPDLLEMRRGEIIADGFCGLPTFAIKSVSLHGSNYILKRGFDIIGSLIILSIFFIPLCLMGILIRLDSRGPIFFTQDRMGFRGRKFKVYKFRTMIIDADAHLERLKKFSDRSGPVFKMKDDPRVTPIGKFIRKFSLDEIPQIFNVLRGDMSLVGPRPQVLWEAAAYNEHAKKRLRIKPGITGLWQVSGRAALSYDEMIDLDIYYLENWSLGLDLKILLRTLPAIFAKEGAY